MHESKEKAKVSDARARTPEPLQSMCIKVVGTRQRTVKRLNAKVDNYELLGARKRDEMQTRRRPQALKTQQNLLVCR